MHWGRGIAVTAVALAGCGLPDGDYFGHVPEPDPTHMRFCNSGEPEFIDPALNTSTTGTKILYAQFAGLTDHDLDGLPEPSIATRWEVGPNLQTFTFHLRADAMWSGSADGEVAARPIVADDFRYQLVRVLNPYTLSRNAETLWMLQHGKLYYYNRLRRIVNDAPPFRAGDVVQIVGHRGEREPSLGKLDIPDANTRVAAGKLALRDRGQPASAAYATVPAGDELIVIELRGDEAYVMWRDGNDGDGMYGWVPAAELTDQPYGDHEYLVRALAEGDTREGTVRGRDILMVPDMLGIETPDDHTVVLRTEFPVPYFIAMSPSRVFRATPTEAVSRRPKRWTLPAHIVTSGAFHLTLWKERDRMELRKSPSYFDADTVRLDKITVYNMNDQGASTNLYFQGGCDAVTEGHIPTSYLPALAGDLRGGRAYKDYVRAPYLGIYFYNLNTEKLRNVHFRRALNHAVDRTAFPKILKGGQIPTAQFTPGVPAAQLSDEDLAACGITRDHPGVAMVMETGSLCYVPPLGLDFDPEKARAELALAREQEGADYGAVISVKYNSGSEGHKLIAEYLQHQWQEVLGIRVELSTQEWKTYLKDTTDGNYEVARAGWIGSFPDSESEFMPVFKCGSPFNRPRWCNDDFMAGWARMEQTKDRHERVKILGELEGLMLQDAPVVPLYVYTQHRLHKPYMRDLAVNFSGEQPWRKAWIDPDWKARR